MKLLFVGNANSFLLIRLAEQLAKSTPGLIVDVVTLEKTISPEANTAFNKVYFESSKQFGEDVRVAKVLFLAKKLSRILKKVGNDYDGVCLLYLSAIYRLTWNLLKQKSSLQVITLFGSEFYRSGAIVRIMQKKMLKEATSITYANELLWNDVSNYFEIEKSKGKRCLFGLSILDEIDQVVQEEIDMFRVDHKLKEQQLIVACGSNSSSNQAFEEIISSIEPFKENLKEVVIFFQFPDFSRSEYAQKIIQQIEVTGIEFRVLDHYLSDRELAVYRKATHTMIQVQNTDQLSGAMQEHLYAGSNVITGEWLPYTIFDELGIDYYKVGSRKEIGLLLVNLVSKPIQANQNQMKIGQLSKWSNAIDDWKAVFNID